jgi:hypothetical protein
MQDEDIVRQIRQLVEQEHQLERSHVGLELTSEEQAKFRQLEATLDQCWDLLRQRRARREFHQDPDQAKVRASEVVEAYRQ